MTYHMVIGPHLLFSYTCLCTLYRLKSGITLRRLIERSWGHSTLLHEICADLHNKLAKKRGQHSWMKRITIGPHLISTPIDGAESLKRGGYSKWLGIFLRQNSNCSWKLHLSVAAVGCLTLKERDRTQVASRMFLKPSLSAFPFLLLCCSI